MKCASSFCKNERETTIYCYPCQYLHDKPLETPEEARKYDVYENEEGIFLRCKCGEVNKIKKIYLRDQFNK